MRLWKRRLNGTFLNILPLKINYLYSFQWRINVAHHDTINSGSYKNISTVNTSCYDRLRPLESWAKFRPSQSFIFYKKNNESCDFLKWDQAYSVKHSAGLTTRCCNNNSLGNSKVWVRISALDHKLKNISFLLCCEDKRLLECKTLWLPVGFFIVQSLVVYKSCLLNFCHSSVYVFTYCIY